VTGKEGIFDGNDYRGSKVTAVLKGIPGSPWFIVAKEDTAELFAPSRFRAFLILALILGLAAAAAAVGVALRQRTEASAYRARLLAETARREGEERYRITLLSVGDGVISTDAIGKVELLNPVAEALTGWPQKEARGRRLEEVFHIVNEDTRDPVENPVARVAREGLVVGLANHTLLIGRDGAEHSIADSGAPIRNEAGEILGVVLVFRDVTGDLRNRKEHETTLQLLRLLNEPNLTHELIQNITRLLQTWTGCETVGVRLKEGDDYPYFETRGFPAEFVQAETFLCERDPAGRVVMDGEARPVLECMCGNILRGRFDPKQPFFTARGSFWSNGTTDMLARTTETDRQARTRNRCNRQGYESVALIRLRAGDETLGLLQLNDRRKNRFTPELITFLENAADQIATGLSQRRTEAALKESETHYRSLFENMLNGFAFCQMLFEGDRPRDFIYLDVNAAFEKLTGLKNVVGRKVSEVIPGIQETDAMLLETYGRVALTGIPERFETRVEALQMWFSISVYSPRKGYFVAVFDVITERKRTEAARQLLASAIEQAAEMIVITDPLGSIQYVNPAFESVTGYAKEEVLGRSPRILKSGEHETSFYEDLWGTIASGKAWAGHFVNKKKDGTRYTEDATISPVHDAEGRIVNYVAVTRDSTHERHLEEQLRQAQKMESVGRLAGGVAHDFNNMLQVISSYVELSLAHVDSGHVLHKNLQQIQKAAQRSAELTGQLLAFARKQTVSPKVLDVNDAVAGMLKMLQRLIGEDIDLAWMPGHAAGKIRIDPSQLDQILANLAVNARDAIAGVGKLTIGTDIVMIDQAYSADHPGHIPGTFVLLTVSDDGSGMSKETLSHIFEPFFTTKGIGQGTGLGLATVYGIVNQNNGFINVYSEVGQGTTFKIYLPRSEGEGAARAQVSEDEPPRGSETVLVVEDEAAILELSKLMLENLGYTALTAQTPAEAIRLVSEHIDAIHLLVTDVVMPQMNGRDLALLITELKPGLKVLFMSGYTADVIAHQGLLDEGVSFVSKPFSMNALAEKIRAALA
jgi:two-component system, cell cycle sensor histidine kinase and response regulator CckA